MHEPIHIIFRVLFSFNKNIGHFHFPQAHSRHSKTIPGTHLYQFTHTVHLLNHIKLLLTSLSFSPHMSTIFRRLFASYRMYASFEYFFLFCFSFSFFSVIVARLLSHSFALWQGAPFHIFPFHSLLFARYRHSNVKANLFLTFEFFHFWHY